MDKKRKHIPKREIEFQESLLKIPDSWIHGTSCMPFDAFEKTANQLDYLDIKTNVYHVNRHIFSRLLLAFSNKPFFIKYHNRFPDRLWQKAGFAEDAVVRLTSFNDLLFWMVLIGYGLHDSNKIDPIGKTVNSSRIDKIESSNDVPQSIKNALKRTKSNEAIREIKTLGNMLKHGWAPNLISCHYWRTHAGTKIGKDGKPCGSWALSLGISLEHYNKYILEFLELKPIDFPKIPDRNDGGKTTVLYCSRKLINHVLNVARKANNLLVDLALLIDEECPFYQTQ